MKESDQLSLSRYVDGDLSPLERKEVEANLQADPAARRLAADYMQIQRYVQELPREAIGKDLVPEIRGTLARKRRLPQLPAGIPKIAGVIAATILVAAFSVPFLVEPARSKVGVFETTSAGKPIIPERASEPESQTPVLIASADKVKSPALSEQPSAPAAPATGGASLEQAKSQSGRSTGGLSEVTKTADMPAALDARYRLFIKATEKVDRKHAARLHVPSASAKQIDSILSLIGKFRAPETDVIERRIVPGDKKKESLAYVVLIPTERYQDFLKEMSKLSDIDVEFDRAETVEEDIEELPQKTRIVDASEFAEGAKRAKAEEEPATEKNEDDFPALHPGESVEIVRDAISKPLADILHELSSDRGTLDEVILWIRSDRLTDESGNRKPTRP